MDGSQSCVLTIIEYEYGIRGLASARVNLNTRLRLSSDHVLATAIPSCAEKYAYVMWRF